MRSLPGRDWVSRFTAIVLALFLKLLVNRLFWRFSLEQLERSNQGVSRPRNLNETRVRRVLSLRFHPARD